MLPNTVAVVGAGPVGCLAALGMAQRGCSVDIYESRKNPALEETSKRIQRSINLAISKRGITGLRCVSTSKNKLDSKSPTDHEMSPGGAQDYDDQEMEDLATLVLRDAVPMHARMIHLPNVSKEENGIDVKLDSQEYGINHECINSVDRAKLNNLLLSKAVAHPRIRVHYQHRLRNIDFDAGDRRRALQGRNSGASTPSTASDNTLAEDQEEGEVRLDFEVDQPAGSPIHKSSWADLVIGCDGIHSVVRSQLAKVVRMDFTQSYIDNGYVELSIPAKNSTTSGSRPTGIGSHDAFHLDPGHLHIWPRQEFMLIALPNPGGDFTCTLFAPFSIFENHLCNPESIVGFFKKHFSDALPLIGEENLVRDIMSRRPSPLGSVKCKPYHYKNRCVIIGDAAHAMLPFYGQGLNCGFEDVRILLEAIDKEEQEEFNAGDNDIEAYASTFEESRSRSNSPVGQASKFFRSNENASQRLDSGIKIYSDEGGKSPRSHLRSLDLANKTERSSRSFTRSDERTPKDSVERALSNYTSDRHEDLVAISELAENNYAEMCSKVTKTSYLLRKKFDTLLMSTLPSEWDWWTSLYTMVTFSNVKYSKAREREARQAKIVQRLAWTSSGLAMTAIAVGLARWRRA